MHSTSDVDVREVPPSVRFLDVTGDERAALAAIDALRLSTRSTILDARALTVLYVRMLSRLDAAVEALDTLCMHMRAMPRGGRTLRPGGALIARR
jgi:hypothetical protein